MIPVYTGFDQRESVGWHAFAQSVIAHSVEPVALVPVAKNLQRDGSNTFTYARFLVPSFAGFEGFAIFVDGADMIAARCLSELWSLRDERFAAQVVKHDYSTRHQRKYVGTELECENRDYPRKNWSSVILWNCAHPANRVLTPEFVAARGGADLHRFSWLKDEELGALPAEWNWLCDEYGVNTAAKLLHFTAGIPGITHYRRSPMAQSWFYHAAMAAEYPSRRS